MVFFSVLKMRIKILRENYNPNLEKIWGKPRKLQNNNVKFWSDPPKSDADSQKSDRGIW